MNDRILLILEAISAEGESTPADLVRATGLPQATLYRLLTEMKASGLIEHDGQGYRVGMRLTRVAFGAHPERQVRQIIGPFLQTLADTTGETAFAARLTPDGVNLFARHLANDGVNGGVLPPSGYRPMICSAAKAIIAYLPAAERLAMVAAANARFPASATEAGAAFDAEIAAIVKASVATCFGIEDPDIGSFAIPVAINGRNGLLSAGIVGPRRRIESNWTHRQAMTSRLVAEMSEELSGVIGSG